MNVLRNLHSKRIATGIIIFMMLVFVLLSGFFIAAEAGHDCCGEDCPICACVQICENTLRQIVGGAAGQTALILPVILYCISCVIFVCVFVQETPVTKKVRMDN